MARPRALTSENYRAEVEEIRASLKRFEIQGGWHNQRAALSEAIGNLYWHFGDTQVHDWYEQALKQYREGHGEPTVKVALLLWKMGRGGECRDECLSVLRLHHTRVEAGTVSQVGPAFQVARRRRELAVSHFMLREYREVLRGEGGGASRQGQRQESGVVPPVTSLAEGLAKGEWSWVREGLVALRKYSPRWPTDGSSLEQDLFRFSLAAAEAQFLSLVHEFEPFGNGKGRGARLHQIGARSG